MTTAIVIWAAAGLATVIALTVAAVPICPNPRWSHP